MQKTGARINETFLILGMLICLLVIFSNKNSAIDILAHSTYFVIAKVHIYLALGIPGFIFGLTHKVLEARGFYLSRKLKIGQFFLYSLCIIACIIFLYSLTSRQINAGDALSIYDIQGNEAVLTAGISTLIGWAGGFLVWAIQLVQFWLGRSTSQVDPLDHLER